MPIRMALTKATGSGEQIVIDVCQWNPVTGDIVHPDVHEMAGLADNLLQFADVRMEEMNVRMLEAYELLRHLPDQYQFMFRELLDVLSGQISPQTLVARWQSIAEENAELERGRQEALERRVQEAAMQEAAMQNGQDV